MKIAVASPPYPKSLNDALYWVEKLAKELLQLYAQKEVVERPSYIEDKEMESQFKSGFPFQETPDQIQTIEDIKNAKDIDTLKWMLHKTAFPGVSFYFSLDRDEVTKKDKGELLKFKPD